MTRQPVHSHARPPFSKRLALGVLLALLSFIAGCSSSRGGFRVTVRHRIPQVVEVPMVSVGGIPFVQVHANGQGPFWFIVDTGCGMDIIHSRLARKLQVKKIGSTRFNTTGQGSMHDGIFVEIGAAQYDPDHVASADFTGFEKAVRRRIDGILGQFFFRCFIVELDYPAKVLRLHPPQQFHRSGQPVPIRFQGSDPMVKGTLELESMPPMHGTFIIDTGANAELRLTDRFVRAHRLEKLPAGTSASKTVMLHGAMETRSTHGVSLKVGAASAGKPLVIVGGRSGQESDNVVDGKIGSGFLQRFRVIIDYPHNRLWLHNPSR